MSNTKETNQKKIEPINSRDKRKCNPPNSIIRLKEDNLQNLICKSNGKGICSKRTDNSDKKYALTNIQESTSKYKDFKFYFKEDGRYYNEHVIRRNFKNQTEVHKKVFRASQKKIKH